MTHLDKLELIQLEARLASLQEALAALGTSIRSQDCDDRHSVQLRIHEVESRIRKLKEKQGEA